MAKKPAKKSARNANYNTARKGAAKRAKRAARQRQSETEYDNEMRGVLFKNNRKQHDAQPDRSGSCTIDGVEYWISGWLRKPKGGGEPFLSLAFTAKDAPEPDYDDVDDEDEDDDDVPF